ncbi:MAG: DciA family protein [Armatimonadota bacterium]
MTGARGQAHVGVLLEGVLANMDARARFRELQAVLAWPQLVGELVAAHSEVETARDGVLIVAADTPVWAHELQMRERELLGLIAKHIGQGVIREIHFRSGRKRRRGAAPARKRPRPSETRLSGRQERQIQDAAAKIEDEALRQRASRAFAALARMAEWRRQTGWRKCQRCGRWQRVGRRWCATCTRGSARRRKR